MEWVGTVCRPDPLCKISTVGTWNRKLGINNIIYVGLLVPIDLLREMIRSTEKRKREVKVYRLVTTCYTMSNERRRCPKHGRGKWTKRMLKLRELIKYVFKDAMRLINVYDYD